MALLKQSFFLCWILSWQLMHFRLVTSLQGSFCRNHCLTSPVDISECFITVPFWGTWLFVKSESCVFQLFFFTTEEFGLGACDGDCVWWTIVFFPPCSTSCSLVLPPGTSLFLLFSTVHSSCLIVLGGTAFQVLFKCSLVMRTELSFRSLVWIKCVLSP